ncbi:MAG: ACP S-malonyltransferase [Deltaproteobacteria bacterium]|nr:ACP S-malonyltransferase [Deltaproteobacteria bacterium]
MGPFGLVFPGQGSQYPGMGQDLHRRDGGVRELFAEAGKVLGEDMAALCFEGPQERLDQTVNTQIAMLTVDLAAWRAFAGRVSAKPLVMAGHSLGEYAALHAAGALNLADVLALVQKRAILHQEAVPLGEGAMAALMGLTWEEAEKFCRRIDGTLQALAPSIENAPGQIVVSGRATAVDALIAAAGSGDGIRAVKLAVSVPCHCPLLAEAAKRFTEEAVRIDFKDCEVPVIPNCDPSILHSRGRTRDLLARQITSPVRWRETIEKMVAMGVETIVELGPKRTLSGLIRRIDRKVRLLNVEDGESLDRTVAALAEG